MFFKKNPGKLDTPMDQFLARQDLTVDQRAVLDVYMTGVAHALAGTNAILKRNGKDPIYDATGERALQDARHLEALLEEFLKQRPDMKKQPLSVCAVLALLSRYPV
ncbi:MAG: hypothetical protein HQL36_06310 [Alphaproteobacteria bacterium]|nr:hypothetical protein [Alphaproteobacteria bacterium]MBF0249626.1 hypothetical protein [Alphaproteobacteria bacterium]